jgi:hypothetical protein
MAAYIVVAVYNLNEPRLIFTDRKRAIKNAMTLAKRTHEPVRVFRVPTNGIVTATDEILTVREPLRVS